MIKYCCIYIAQTQLPGCDPELVTQRHQCNGVGKFSIIPQYERHLIHFSSTYKLKTCQLFH